MELADRAVGFLLSFISLSIFTYYTFWVIILVSIQYILQYILLAFYELRIGFWCLYILILSVVQPFVDSDHFIHQYFLPQEYAIFIPVFAGVVLLCFLCIFIGFVTLKSKKKAAWCKVFVCCPAHWILSFGCSLSLFGRGASQTAGWWVHFGICSSWICQYVE